ncbi:MAG TPA: family 20 glycosylhydrolase, partial [Phycisphaerales bacterium]|nr:family 20 glycosylhydrolase [Phycisphaerales bacterium]
SARATELETAAAPLTDDEVRRLDALCTSRGIDLGANQNCFGHLREWLRHPGYADLAEIEAEGVWRFMQWERRGPFSLNPTDPRSLALVGGLLEELTACVTSRRVNIGCDETFDVGFGKSKRWVEARAAELLAAGADGPTLEAALERARSALYFEFVGRVCAAAQRLGRAPMMWADIALKHPEMLHLLPSGVTGLIWGYEPETDFAAGVRAWARGGRGPAWVCPGTSCWRSIVGRTREARANIARGAAEGHQAGCEGFMVCAWGDVGHMQAWPITARRLADAAEAAWNPPSPPSLSTSPTPSPTARGPLVGETMLADPRAVSLHVFGDETLTVGAWLDELGDVDERLRRTAHANYSPDPGSRGIQNAGALFTDLFPPVPVPGAGQGRRAVEASAEQWRAVRERLAALSARRPRLPDERLDAELAHTVRFAAFAAEHAMAMRMDEVKRGEVLARLIVEAEAVLAEHRRLWRMRSRVMGEEGGGLGESCSHLRRVIEALRAQGGRGA